MKRKEGVKTTKSKPIEGKPKKSLVKPKPKDRNSKKQQQPEFFVFVGDQVYVASSKTERKHYQQFEQKVKVGSNNLKKSKKRGASNFKDTINVQEYVKSLSKGEKQKLLHDLQKEFEEEKVEQINQVEEKEDKMVRLAQKLQCIKGELILRWDEQITKINHSFQNEQIGLEQKNQKIILIQKIKNNKIAMLNYTKVLFQKILKEEPDIQLQKSARMEHIINSLNSISSLDPREPFHLQNHQFQNLTRQIQTGQNNSFEDNQQLHEQSQQNNIQLEVEQQQQIKQEGLGKGSNIKIQDFQKSQSLIMSKQSLKLDIRLDEVQFGKDSYEEQVLFTKQSQNKVDQSAKEQAIRLQFNKFKNEVAKPISKINNIPITEKNKLPDDFLCTGQEQLKIPLLMTKDRLEQIQLQKSAKQVEGLTINIKARQNFQLSQIIPKQNNDHFTTLIDVNQFVVQFYEFVMRYFMRQVVQGMNIPYGKSCVDKLYMIRQEGYVPDHDHNNVLPQDYLDQFYLERTRSAFQIAQQEKIHNLAIFQAFNIGLNVYRPYFELEGEVFPWRTSEKGLTFYQINDENIEQVFQKSKMKVLEYCSSLCGLMVDGQVTTAQAKKMLTKRNEDVLERVLKSEMLQKFGEWSIKKINFQALSRINLCNQIFESQIQQFCLQLLRKQR